MKIAVLGGAGYIGSGTVMQGDFALSLSKIVSSDFHCRIFTVQLLRSCFGMQATQSSLLITSRCFFGIEQLFFLF
jgi:UDP-glucose 4-epimerase